MRRPAPWWREPLLVAAGVFLLLAGIVFFAWLTNNGLSPTP